MVRPESTLSAVRAAPRETKVVVSAISASQFVNHAYLTLFPPIFSVLVGEFEVGLTGIGIALGVQGATNTLCQLPFGHLADRYDRTLALALSSIVGALGVLLAAAAPTYEWFVLGQAVIGVGVAGHHPAHYPLISDATPEDLLGRAYSVYGFGGSLGFATPPALLAAVLSAGYSWRVGVAIVGVGGLVYALAIVALFARRVSDDVTAPNVDGSGGEAPVRERVRSYLRSIAGSPGILALAVLALVSSTANWGFTSYVVVFLTDGYGLDLSTANLALTGVFVVGSVAVFAGGALADRYAPGPVMLGTFAAVTALFGLLASSLLPAAAAVALVLAIGGARSLAGPARSKLTDTLSTTGSTGTNFAVVTVGVMLGNAIAPPLFGYIIDTASPALAFGVVTVVSALAVGVTAWVVWRFEGA